MSMLMVFAVYIIIASLIVFKFELEYQMGEDMGLFLKFCKSFMPTIFTVILSNLGSKVLDKYQRNEIHLKKSKYFRGRVWRMVWFQLITYYLSLILVVVLTSIFISEQYEEANFIIYTLKFTFVKSFIDPIATVGDLSYLISVYKSRQATRSLSKKGEKSEDKKFTKYDFYPKSALEKMVQKPRHILDKKYSRVFTVLIIDTLNSKFLSSPYISIFYLIFQYCVDKLFYSKRYTEDPSGPLTNKSMVHALQIIPKLVMVNEINFVLDRHIQLPSSYTLYAWAIYLIFFVMFFVPFESIAEAIYQRLLLRKERREKERDLLEKRKEDESDGVGSDGESFGPRSLLCEEDSRIDKDGSIEEIPPSKSTFDELSLSIDNKSETKAIGIPKNSEYN